MTHGNGSNGSVATKERPRAGPSEAPSFFDDLPVAVLVFADDELLVVNDQWTAMTGLDLVASTGDRWLSAVAGDDQASMKEFIRTSVSGDDRIGDWRLTGPGNRGVAWVHARVRFIRGRGPATTVMTLTEIDTHAMNDSRLLHLATHDVLTGLLNRAVFIAQVEDALERATSASTLTAVLFVDLDHFKEVNDRMGHRAGDQLLVAVARRMQSRLRPTDCAGRLGGDELGVLCPVVTKPGDAVRLAERLVQSIAEPFTVNGEVVRIGASIGIAFSTDPSMTAAALVDNADRAMYQAKQDGRDRCSVFGGDIDVQPA